MPSTTSGNREITLLQERSAGTFAQVFLAHSTDGGGLNRFVAVKVLKERWNKTADIIDRTRDEAQLLASLQHQNIVRVDAITEIDGRTAIIMEFVHGLDLAQLLRALRERNVAVPPRTLFDIAEGIASALAAAWFKVPIGRSDPLRVVHRDIKPSNVMVSTEGELRVLDFGTARFDDVSRQATTQAFRFGSMKYMSPERRAGSRGDHPADLYSLGLVIIELFGQHIHEPLPTDPTKHDAAVLSLINAIPDFGLPNAGWDNSIRETLGRLCAAEPAERLDARQTVKLMRAFKEQASGTGLVAFAEDTVAPLTRAINAIPRLADLQPKADAGRFTLDADGRTAVIQRIPTRPNDLTDLPTEVETQRLSESELPTMISQTALAPDEPTQTGAVRSNGAPASPTPSAPADAGIQSDDLGPEDDSSHWLPRSKRRKPPADPNPHDRTARRLPPVRPANSKNRALVLGFGLMAIMLAAVATGAWLAWAVFGPTDPTPAADAPTSRTVDAATTALPSGQTVAVSLHAGDPTVQWVRLEDMLGNRLVNARPDGEARVASGTHRLSVKVTARTKLTGNISIENDTSLTCKPATMGRVRCTDANGETRILLRPSK
ncbi:MAG: serine/threonine-protein kinase [Myxococcota bacterium]|nr:serine/threonine-protein kinase [Myxococcota bacterium]